MAADLSDYEVNEIEILADFVDQGSAFYGEQDVAQQNQYTIEALITNLVIFGIS